MRKEEFLRQLEMLLSDISEEERTEAMAFYRSYFEEAGIGNEARIIAELGSPEEVAEIIKRDLGMITVMEAERADEEDTSGTTYTHRRDYSRSQSYTEYSENTSTNTEEKNTMLIVLLVLLAVFTFPLWIGFVLGLFGTVFGLSVALVACTFALFAVGVAFVGVGIPMAIGISGVAGVAFVGAGLMVLALGLLLLNVCVWTFGKAFPWVISGIRRLGKMLLGKIKGE